MADDFFDFSPGAQIPVTGGAGGTAATHALASVAYRDDPLEKITEADGEWHKTTVKPGKLKIFAPLLGEAFSQAVVVRMLGAGRSPLIQAFGMEPQVVVEHCLAASRLRKQRDRRLTLVALVCGVLFLPGAALWVLAFQLRAMSGKWVAKGADLLGTLLMLVGGIASVVLLIGLPTEGILPWYIRGCIVGPVLGWFLAKQLAERTAQDLRAHWSSLLAGGGSGAKIPEAVPANPDDAAAEQLRVSLAKLAAEQQSNSVFYAGPKGILGMGTRWGSWQLAEDLEPAEAGKEINPFRSWDVIRAIHDQLQMLERGPLHTGGFPKPSVKHWIVSPVGENAGGVSRPEGETVEAYQVKPHEIQRICNEQQFSNGNRHYLGVQFVLWDGQLVLTMLITVTVLHHTLRIEVTGHALGPVHGLFSGGPAARERTTAKPIKFWETKTHRLPLVDATEVVRLLVRAPLTPYPPVLDFLGGKLALPEPFGLRHVWAGRPWANRFMADDALRTAAPVLRVVHKAALRVLEENGVDTSRFAGRAAGLSGAVQDAAPKKADLYDA